MVGVLWLALGLLGDPARATISCPTLTPPTAAVSDSPLRDISADDLARLRDIGMPGYSVPDQSPFTISPDHKMVAFTIRQADPVANTYCQGLYVADLAKPGSARQVDEGGEVIYYTINDLRGLVNSSGTPAIITPAWSPDGRWIAYLKRINHVSQIWRVRVGGSFAKAVTTLDIDAEAVVWSSDGRRLIFSIRPALADLRRKIDEEGRTGYRQDRRVIPVAGAKPLPQVRSVRHPSTNGSDWSRWSLPACERAPRPCRQCGGARPGSRQDFRSSINLPMISCSRGKAIARRSDAQSANVAIIWLAHGFRRMGGRSAICGGKVGRTVNWPCIDGRLQRLLWRYFVLTMCSQIARMPTAC
jgi:hypothetical protein